MTRRKNRRTLQRSGTAALLLCILMVPLLGLLAFSVDYGMLLFVKTDMQRTADQAAIAAVRDLVPDQFGDQDLAKVKATLREYVELNLGEGFSVNDEDIKIGRYDPDTIYGDVQLLETGIFDTVRVKIRRDASENHSVSLYFARLIGHDEAFVAASATAVLQRARYLGPGAEVFPVTIEQQTWNHLNQGEVATIYGDGQIVDQFGDPIPGNWGTVDIGPRSNSSTGLSNQILNGLTQLDLDSLHRQNVIPTSEYIDSSIAIDLNGDTGLSSGIKHAVWEVEGRMKIAPIYKTVIGHGGNLEFEIVSWVTIEIVDSHWKGNNKSSISVRKSFTYDENLWPVRDLSDLSNTIEGAFTAPVLIE